MLLEHRRQPDDREGPERAAEPLPAVGRSTLTQRHVVQLSPDQRADAGAKMDAAWKAKAEGKPASWVTPDRAHPGSEALVGTIYFHTKDSALEAHDRELLTQLATAFAPAATRSQGHGHRGLGGQVGFSARIVGYADPRPSVEPDNRALSKQRADHTAAGLAQASASATGLAETSFPFIAHGAGVDATVQEGGVEGDSLSISRRAEIFVDAEASAAKPASPGGPARQDVPAQVAPPKGSIDTDWGRYDKEVEAGDHATINGLAMRAYAVAENGLEVLEQTFKVFGIVPIKPPWWDGRGAAFEPHGRGALAKPDPVIRRAKLLVRDMKEYAYWYELHVAGPHSTLSRYRDVFVAAEENDAQLLELGTPLGYLFFMMQSIDADATALLHDTH